MLTAGPRGQFPRWRRSRKRLSVCSVLRCPDLWLRCSVSFGNGLEKTHHAGIQWDRQFVETGCLCKGKSPGQLHVSDDNIERVCEAFLRSPCKSVAKASRELDMPKMTVWKVLHKRLCFKPLNFWNRTILLCIPCTDRQTDMTKTPENYWLRTGSITVLNLQARVMPAVCKALGLRRALCHTSTWVGAGLILSWGKGTILSSRQWFILNTGRYDILIKMWHKIGRIVKFFGFRCARQYYWKFSIMLLRTWKPVREIYSLLKNKKPTRCHLLFYCTSCRLNMFQALLCPSSGARDCNVDYHIGRFVLGLL